jgi:hypothetical protein
VKVNNSVSLSCNEIVKGFHKEMHRDHQPQTVPELISQLEQASQKTGKGKAQKRIFKILNSDKNIVSWKFNEWDYAKEKATDLVAGLTLKFPKKGNGPIMAEYP